MDKQKSVHYEQLLPYTITASPHVLNLTSVFPTNWTSYKLYTGEVAEILCLKRLFQICLISGKLVEVD